MSRIDEMTPILPSQPKIEPIIATVSPRETISAETVAQALRQQTEQPSEYKPSEILETIENATINSHSLEDLFRAGRELTRNESKLRDLGDLKGLAELKALQVAYENKIAELYNTALTSYNKLVDKTIPKFEASLIEKPNYVMRLFQPRNTQIAKANKLINKLLDFQEIFNKLASCKDIGLSKDGKECVYLGQLGIIPAIHEHIQDILKRTADDINKILTDWQALPTQLSTKETAALSHGGIVNMGNGCYSIPLSKLWERPNILVS